MTHVLFTFLLYPCPLLNQDTVKNYLLQQKVSKAIKTQLLALDLITQLGTNGSIFPKGELYKFSRGNRRRREEIESSLQYKQIKNAYYLHNYLEEFLFLNNLSILNSYLIIKLFNN